MSVCTFFGHSACYNLDMAVLRGAVEELIGQGVTEFLVGNQGQFDGMVRSCLKSLKAQYPEIAYCVVLAYLPGENGAGEDLSDTMFPEGLESVHPKFAISRRNRYLIDHADVCLCYINHTWGGAYKFVRMAQSRGLRIVNIGSAGLEEKIEY